MDTATIALTALAWALQLGGLAVIIAVVGYFIVRAYRDHAAREAAREQRIEASLARAATVVREAIAYRRAEVDRAARADVDAWLDYPTQAPR